MPNLQEFDMDKNLINNVNSNYYDIMNFPKIRTTSDSFSIFHLNLRSLTTHFDELQLLLSALKLNFDVIGISETKEQSGVFLSNINLDFYILYSQCSNTSVGGVGLYVKENLDHIIRFDLSIVEEEFETIWVEIKNTKSQNIFCACTYRHSNTDIKKYVEYRDKNLLKISKESKLVFVMGDFNVNLLNYESHNKINDFINTMASRYLLSYILHPTRVTGHSATVIDNIFSDNIFHKTISGNIIILASVSFWPLLFIESVARVSQDVLFTHELLVNQV